mgnify:CR=1 FL=1
MATLWNLLGEMMVLVGDLLALVAAGAGVLAMAGEQRGWNKYTLRQIWSNGIAATVLSVVGLAAKLTTDEMAAAGNGYLFGLSNWVIGGLLLVALAALAGAYLSRRANREG